MYFANKMVVHEGTKRHSILERAFHKGFDIAYGDFIAIPRQARPLN